MKKEFSEKFVAELREVYGKYRGTRHDLIEKEMRERGWKKFRREQLVNKRTRRTLEVGLIAKLALDQGVELGRSRGKRRRIEQKLDLEAWLTITEPKWKWSWGHQRLLYAKLREVSMGRLKRLMIMMPPRHGKSELVTVRYVAYRLTRDPSLNVIVGSYNQRLANRFSRKIRNVWAAAQSEPPASAGGREPGLMNGEPALGAVPPAHAGGSDLGQRGNAEQRTTQSSAKKRRTPPLLRKEGSFARAVSRSAAEWETTVGGGVRAVGVGAGITGFGARLVVIDDPVKNRAEAESEAYRGRVWDWFNDDIYTRLEPDAAVILIQTRWHEDDLAGRLISEMANGGEKWDVVSLPALAESVTGPSVNEGADGLSSSDRRVDDGNAGGTGTGALPNGRATDTNADPLGRAPGEALCPERYDEAALERIKRKLGSYSFAALYQQRPVLAAGGIFKREWFSRIIEFPPEGSRWTRGYDLAVSTKASADYTATFRCAMDTKGNIYIADGFRGRIEFPDQRRLLIERMLAERDTTHCIEQALHGTAIVQDLRRERSVAHVPLRACRVDADKVTRALAWANRAEEGKIILVRGSWIADFLDEVASFPHGRHDDQIDAVSLAIGVLAGQRRASFGF